MEYLPWKDIAACRSHSTSLFFPYHPEQADPAKSVCNLCPAKKDCLDYALKNAELQGVWGGTTEEERRKMRRAAYDRRRKRERIWPGDGDLRHGTENGYSNLGCRCAECTGIYLERQRARQRRVEI